MRVRYLGKGSMGFIRLGVWVVCLLLAVLAGLGQIYRYSTVTTYESILIIVIVLIIIITLIVVLSVALVFYAYRRKRVTVRLIWLFRLGLKVLLPFVNVLAELIRNKDEIRKFYIELNNILVQSGNRKYTPSQVLLLLPHCLQASGCGYKITSDIANCRKCGKCCIGEIRCLAENAGVMVAIATGGTLARKLVKTLRPKLILSVACERDLASGISDVGGFPVIGVINERPNGPCVDTTVNINVLKENLERFLKI